MKMRLSLLLLISLLTSSSHARLLDTEWDDAWLQSEFGEGIQNDSRDETQSELDDVTESLLDDDLPDLTRAPQYVDDIEDDDVAAPEVIRSGAEPQTDVDVEPQSTLPSHLPEEQPQAPQPSIEPLHDESQTPSARISEKQHHRPAPPSGGLPQECLFYEQRYKRHNHKLVDSAGFNGMHPHSQYVVVLKLHKLQEDRLQLDLVMNARALATEVTAVGYHFYILFQAPTHNSHSADDDGETRLTREDMLQLLPSDLRPFVIIHDYEDDFAAYPALRGDDMWASGHRATYVALSRFMRRYQAYQYAWVLEYDARWTGSSWGTFLNAAMDLGRQATYKELEAHPQRIVPMDRTASRRLPTDPGGLPDLLTMGGIRHAENSNNIAHSMSNMTTLFDMAAAVYMGSRRLWDLVHGFSVLGIGADTHIALPTIAMQQGLKVASIQLPKIEAFPDYLICCSGDASMLYTGWYNHSDTCVPSMLLHPVKTNEVFWPKLGPSHA